MPHPLDDIALILLKSLKRLLIVAHQLTMDDNDSWDFELNDSFTLEKPEFESSAQNNVSLSLDAHLLKSQPPVLPTPTVSNSFHLSFGNNTPHIETPRHTPSALYLFHRNNTEEYNFKREFDRLEVTPRNKKIQKSNASSKSSFFEKRHRGAAIRETLIDPFIRKPVQPPVKIDRNNLPDEPLIANIAELEHEIAIRVIKVGAYKKKGRKLKNHLFNCIAAQHYMPEETSKAVTVAYLWKVYQKQVVRLPKSSAAMSSRMRIKLPKTTIYGIIDYRLRTQSDKQLGYGLDNLPDKSYLIRLLRIVYPEFPGFSLNVESAANINPIQQMARDVNCCIRILSGQAAVEAHNEAVLLCFNNLTIDLAYYKRVLIALFKLYADLATMHNLRERMGRAAGLIEDAFGGFGERVALPNDIQILIRCVLAARDKIDVPLTV